MNCNYNGIWFIKRNWVETYIIDFVITVTGLSTSFFLFFSALTMLVHALAAQIRFSSIQFDWLRPSWSLQLFQDQFQCSRCGCYQSIFSVAFIVFFCHVLVRRAQCSKIWFPPCFLHGQSTEVFFFVCAKLCSVWFPALLFVLVAVSSCDTLDFPENTHLKNTELPFRIFIQRPGSRVV